MALVRVMVADHHEVVRRGIMSVLERSGACEIVAETADAQETLDAVGRTLPAVVLLDPSMPNMTLKQVTACSGSGLPEGTAVLAMSTCADRQYVARTLADGAKGFLLKSCDSQELVQAVQTVASGSWHLSPSLAAMVMDDYLHGRGPDQLVLTQREQDILQMLNEGLSAKEIGRSLHVSSRTVDSHRQRIMAKLKVRSVAALTKCAIRMGLTTVEV